MPILFQRPFWGWLQTKRFEITFYLCLFVTLVTVFALSLVAPVLVILGAMLGIGVGIAIFRSLPVGVSLLLLLSVFPGLITSNISTIKGLRVFNLLFLMNWGILAAQIFLFERSQFRILRSPLCRPIILVWLFYWVWDYLHGFAVGSNVGFESFLNAAFKPLQFISIYYLVLYTTVRRRISEIYLYVILLAIFLAGILFQQSIAEAMQAVGNLKEARSLGFYEANEFGVYAAYMMAFCIVMFYGVHQWWARALVLAALASASAAMLLSGSRGGLLSVLFTLPICFWYMKKKQRIIWGVLLAVFGFLVLFGTHSKETVLSRFQNTFTESLNRNNSVDMEKFSSGRLSRVINAAELIAENPTILIYGYEQTSGGRKRYINPHNFYVDSLFRSGVACLVVVIWFAGVAFGHFRRIVTRFKEDPYIRAWAHGTLAAFTTLLINGIWMHSFLGYYTVAPLVGMMAVSTALADQDHCPPVSESDAIHDG